VLRTVVPAAPDAWIAVLKRYGTMSFRDVARRAIQLAADGFPMYPLMAESLASQTDKYRQWPSNAAIYLPKGRPPKVGEIFVQTDLGRTLQHLVDEEEGAQARGREAGLEAARDAFYRGDVAAAIVRFQRESGGLLTAQDLAEFRSSFERPVVRRYYGLDVFTCGPWCQGPVLLQMLSLLEPIDLAGMRHNTPCYLHTVLEAMKLAFADRDRYYGDPRFVDVPLDRLLAADYAATRRRLIDPDRACPQMPQAGEFGSVGAPPAPAVTAGTAGARDTSYVCVVDSSGNVFSATPSDDSSDTPVTPGTGLCVSSRGSQSWGIRGHPSAVAPGKRPRLTPNPAIVVDPARQRFIPLGSPGGDVQAQAMLQALLNMRVFGMSPQEAVEAPRAVTYSFPESFEPHAYRPGLVTLEGRISGATGDVLSALGHRVEWWPDLEQQAGSVCLIDADRRSRLLAGAADPRRAAYALGW
jgi:gamma-glutamyltranspeptidase/glutathione hydrolase